MFARTAAAALTALILIAAPACAGEGVNLAWDDCGSHGSFQRSFACNVNTGSESLIGSFVTDAAPHQLAGIVFTLDLISESVELPAWWELRNSTGFPNQCRNGSVGASADFSQGPANCYDTFRGIAFGAVTSFEPGAGGLNRARLTGSFVVPALDPEPFPAETETYAFKVIINHAKSVGNACGGCSVPVCITFSELIVTVGAGEPDRVIHAPIDRNFVLWQNSPVLCTVSAKRPTWGAIKTLYR